ncbi:MAG: non-homologous end-joining DNA ligase [Hyphomicrobiaceae bacterium]
MVDKLETYRSKRDFKRTPEPEGGERTVREAPHRRFVVHKHDARQLHYDLRLEMEGVFHSWAITRGPSLDPGEKRLAVEVEDHPLAYGDFEGTIPKGEYGGGTVMIWDRGYWALEDGGDPARALERGELKLVLAGSKLTGAWVLVRMKGDRGKARHNWLLIKHRDKWAASGAEEISEKDRSVASGRTMAAIAKGTGEPPEPFVLNGQHFSSDAEWSSKTGLAEAKPMPAVAPARLTHPDRVLWPDEGLTKRDLAAYLGAAADWILPHVAGRPCSLLRAPDGIGEATFFQRHPMRGQPPSITPVTVDPGDEPYLRLDTAGAVADVAQISAIELHPWNCAPDAPKVPGRLVFDLDPGAGVGFDDVVAAARLVKANLERLGLVTFCKTTGGKGLHVVTPLEPDTRIDWDQAKLFAHTLAARIAEESPGAFVTKMAKAARRGRIFIDYLRNDETATAVAPLSPRARKGAAVSMPLTWRQVRRGLDPARFTIRTALTALQSSRAWEAYSTSSRPLRPAMQKLAEMQA